MMWYSGFIGLRIKKPVVGACKHGLGAHNFATSIRQSASQEGLWSLEFIKRGLMGMSGKLCNEEFHSIYCSSNKKPVEGNE
jgi:hypothetical protein